MHGGKERGLSVLFVCLGNICRSPIAEGAFRKAADDAGLNVRIDSAGTAAYHIGEPPDPRAIAVAQRQGVNISDLRGRQLTDQDFHTFTHIFALDTANLAGIEARGPRHHTADIGLLLDVFDDPKGASVADPYYGDESDFEECWDQVSAATQRLAQKLKQEWPASTA